MPKGDGSLPKVSATFLVRYVTASYRTRARGAGALIAEGRFNAGIAAIVQREIVDSRFVVATTKPRVKVSWPIKSRVFPASATRGGCNGVVIGALLED